MVIVPVGGDNEPDSAQRVIIEGRQVIHGNRFATPASNTGVDDTPLIVAEMDDYAFPATRAYDGDFQFFGVRWRGSAHS